MSNQKILLVLFLLSIFLISGCYKIEENKDVDKDNNEMQNDRIEYLFSKNNLSLDNLKFDSIVEEKDFGVNHLNLTHIRFNQEYKSLPIYSSQIIYHFNEDRLESISGNRIDNLNLDIKPKITKSSAIRMIKNRMSILRPDVEVSDEDIVLGVFNLYKDPELAYWDMGMGSAVVVINANNGKVLYEFNGIFT